MAIRIDGKCIGKEIPGNYYALPKLEILPPEDVDELIGYAMYISEACVIDRRKSEGCIYLDQAMEIDKDGNKVFVFERKKKEPGKKFKKFRYNPSAMIRMYNVSAKKIIIKMFLIYFTW